MAFYKGYNNESSDQDAATLENLEDFEADQVNADILDSLFAEEEDALSEEEEDALSEEGEILPESEEDSDTEWEEPVEEQDAQDVQEPSVSRKEQEGTTLITKGTTINGSIISDCSLDVMGTINGDIECLGKLSISGKVVGNSTASEVYVNTDRLEGSIKSEGCVKIAQKTIVIGDIAAASGVIAGAVKGDLDVAGPVVIDSTAVVQGDITAKSIQINNGAVLDGRVSLSYATGIDLNNIFAEK